MDEADLRQTGQYPAEIAIHQPISTSMLPMRLHIYLCLAGKLQPGLNNFHRVLVLINRRGQLPGKVKCRDVASAFPRLA